MVWSRVVYVAVFISFAAAGLSPTVAQVVVNELHYNPPGDDATVMLEFIELHNAGTAAVDIGAWKLRFGPEDFVFPLGTTIEAEAYLVVAENRASLLAATGHAAAFEWFGLQSGLSNGGETVLLLDSELAIVDSVSYDDDPPWTGVPDGTGPSLELVNPTLHNDVAASWMASNGTHGTPGLQNSVYSEAPRVESEIPRRKSAVETLPGVTVTFSAAVSGVTPEDLTVDGSPATAVSCETCVDGVGQGPYEFTGFAAPEPGSTTIELAAGNIDSSGIAFAGDVWTVSVGLVVIINEIHYHPPDAVADAEFVEIHNAGAVSADLSGWSISDGLDMLFPPGTFLPQGAFLIIALDPALLESITGYSGALAWSGGRLSNGGERIALSDEDGNELDVVSFGDGGVWPPEADGDGPSIELVNPRLPNQYGSAWRASLAAHGTPGTQNGTYDPAPAPIITGVLHSPPVPAPMQSITVIATVIDDAVTPTVTLHSRQDQDPTIEYSSIPMWDDGAHGDGAAGDRVFGATLPGLPDGERLDFTIRADDGTGVSAAPPGHDSLDAGGYPSQTFLCEFTGSPLPTDFPMYRLITTQRTRNLQDAHDASEYDATFLECDALDCEIFYNVIERYRGQSSLGLHPHSFRINFPADHPLQSEMGFEITRLNLVSQSRDKQHLGYQFFREAFGGTIPTPMTQFVRFHTSPLSHGGVQDYVYVNVERLDGDFLESQNGAIAPTRFPDRCSVGAELCDIDSDCATGETCVPTDSGNLYRGQRTGDLQYLGALPDPYPGSYDKETNVEADIWFDLIDQCYSLDEATTPETMFESEIEDIADETEWARWFAIHMLLVNQEGGIYRDTGDDYYLYFEPETSPMGPNAKFLAWDMDSVFGGFRDRFDQETIWRTTVPTTQRFVRSNAFAGRFVGSICELLDSEFTTEVMDPRIEAIPDVVADATRKQALKDFIVARRDYVNNEIRRQLTLTGVPASPYTDPDPEIVVSGELNQCGTRTVTVNGLPADFSVYSGTWSANVTLTPGPNTIVVQDFDRDGNELDRIEQSVTYSPPGAPWDVRLTVPDRMLVDRTLTLRAEIVDSLGRIDWKGCPRVGNVSARRVLDGSDVPITVTVFDNHVPVPADSIRFYNGIGSVSFTLDEGAAFPGGDIEVRVEIDGLIVSEVVTVESTPTFREVSGILSGADLTWGPDDNIRITGDVTVPSGASLDVLPGTLVMVDTTGSLENGTLITVDGTIQAIGTEDRPIYLFSERGPAAMTLTQAGSASNANAWQGIFHNGVGTSRYEWVILTGAGNGTVIGHPRPPILRFNDFHSLVMDHSMLVDNNGMTITGPGGGNYAIRNSLISRCGIGAEFNGAGHTLLIEDTWWTSCGHAPESEGLDGDLIHIDGPTSNQTIRRSIFADGGDDGIDHSGSTYTAENLIIYDIRDKAVSMTAGFADFSNTLVYDAGLGIRGSASCTNCTIAVDTPILSPQSVQQSIIWPSSLDTCASDMDYSIVGSPDDLGCGVGNFSQDPLYRDPAQCDYTPASGSPAYGAGPAGERIGWLGFPQASSCSADADCVDNHPCTTDSCVDGVCSFEVITGCATCDSDADCIDGNPCTVNSCGIDGVCTAVPGNDGATCDDGIACTVDQCSAGTCVGTSACPVGLTCDLGSDTCVPQEATRVFLDDGAYTGTEDTDVGEGTPDTVRGTLTYWGWDLDGVPGGGVPSRHYALLKFANVFGTGAGQIPVGSTIRSATLTLEVADSSIGPAGDIHESAVDWSETEVTWNNFGGEPGVQPDEIGAWVATAPLLDGPASIDVTTSLQAWSEDPSSNRGWIFVPATEDAVLVRATEWGTVNERPRLSVTFVRSGCVLDSDCDDGNACTDDTCDSVQGCVHTAVGDGVSCDDGQLCTEDDRCTTGVCGGTEVDCSSLDDACNVGACNSGTGGCEPQPLPNGTSCEDGDLCTEDDVCTTGVCGGTEVDCSSLDDACNVGACNSGTGGCEPQPLTNGTSCEDGDLCTEDDVCTDGVCGGAPVDCSSLDDACNVGVCNGTTGDCEIQALTDGTSCEDGNACTTGDSCQLGVCVGGDPPNCDDGNACMDDTCDSVQGCVHTAVGDGVSCDDGQLCTEDDRCTTGVCGGTEVDCSSLDDACNVGACNSGTGGCEPQPLTNGTSCEDGDLCTEDDVCTDGVCGGAPVDCSSLDDACNVGVCNGTTGDCEIQALTDGTSCEDGNACTTGDSCQLGVCVGGDPPNCDDDNTCNGIETCDTATGECLPGSPSDATVQLVVPDDAAATPGTTVRVPVLAVPSAGTSMDLRVTWDPSVLQSLEVHSTAISSESTLDADLSTPGLAIVSISGAEPLVGAGPVVEIEFLVVGAAGQQTAVSLSEGLVEQGAVSSCVDGGQLAVCADLPGEVEDVLVIVSSQNGDTLVTWSDPGGGNVFDVASGTLADLWGDGSTVWADCLAANVSGTSVVDSRVDPDPASSVGYYYLVRSGNTCGAGSYGSATTGEERVPAWACP